MTITEFLEARITEDENDAVTDAAEMARSSVTIQFDCVTQARFNPSRVLAECAAKRALIGLEFDHLATIDGEWGCGHSAEEIRAGECEYQPGAEATALRILAAVYKDHPDCRQEWR